MKTSVRSEQIIVFSLDYNEAQLLLEELRAYLTTDNRRYLSPKMQQLRELLAGYF